MRYLPWDDNSGGHPCDQDNLLHKPMVSSSLFKSKGS